MQECRRGFWKQYMLTFTADISQVVWREEKVTCSRSSIKFMAYYSTYSPSVAGNQPWPLPLLRS
jgi:hypothetical protein